MYLLRPEVAGGLGPGTQIENREQLERDEARYPQYRHLHYHIEGWLGDHLLTSVGCYIATEELVLAMQDLKLTGFSVGEVEVSTSPNFDLGHPALVLPRFVRLLVHGTVELGNDKTTYSSWSGHDLCLGHRAELVLSAAGLAGVDIRRIANGRISTIRPERSERSERKS